VSPVRYEQGFYIPQDDILHGHCRDNLKSYVVLVFVLKTGNTRLNDNLSASLRFSLWLYKLYQMNF
jgi:hypothetical protein